MSHRATGLRAWVIQRVTALYLMLFLSGMLGYFVFYPPTDYQQWRGLLAHPAISVLVLLSWVSLLLHMWVGLRDVILDYVRPIGVRFTMLSLVAFGLSASGIWVLLLISIAHR